MGIKISKTAKKMFQRAGRKGGYTAAANMSKEARLERARKASAAAAEARRKRKGEA